MSGWPNNKLYFSEKDYNLVSDKKSPCWWWSLQMFLKNPIWGFRSRRCDKRRTNKKGSICVRSTIAAIDRNENLVSFRRDPIFNLVDKVSPQSASRRTRFSCPEKNSHDRICPLRAPGAYWRALYRLFGNKISVFKIKHLQMDCGW